METMRETSHDTRERALPPSADARPHAGLSSALAARSTDRVGRHSALPPSLFRFLATCELFAGVPEHRLLALTPAIRHLRVPRNEVLCADDGIERVHMVVRGALRVLARGGSLEERTLTIAGRGSVLLDTRAEIAGERWTQRICAYAPSLVLSIARGDLDRAAVEDGRIAVNLASLLERRVLWLERQGCLMASATPQQRIASTILDLAEQHGHPTLDGGTMIDVRLLQRDIAELVGASRQVVSSTMAAMRRRGVIETSRQRIVVRDELGLRRLATT